MLRGSIVRVMDKKKVNTSDGLGAPSPKWMSEELISDTQQVWSKVYGRQINREEAINILHNTANVATVFRRIIRDQRASGCAPPTASQPSSQEAKDVPAGDWEI